ncbi:MAG: protein phosphatase 2C domain-containing protein [Azonexus sp.]
MNYLISILGSDSAKDLGAFLDVPEITSLFGVIEKKLRQDWANFAKRQAVNLDVQKWSAPPIKETAKLLPPPAPVEAQHSPRPHEATPIGKKENPLMSSPPGQETTPEPSPASPLALPQTPPAPSVLPTQTVSAPPPLPEPLMRAHVPVTFKLRNARQSERYSAQIEYEPADAQIRLIDVMSPAELFFTCDLNSSLVEGIPSASGDFTIEVRYRWNDDSPVTERKGNLTLYVNADPKLLWKNLESNRSDPLWKEDEAAQLVCGEDRRIVAARKRGRSHAHVGTCCDDDFYLQHNSDKGWYVAIVADGAGSAKSSRQGSRVAVRTAGSFLKDVLAGEDGDKVATAVAQVQAAGGDGIETARRVLHNALYVTVGHAAHRAMKALFDEAQARPELIDSVKDLATTLLIGVARKFGNQWLCAAYWVGDGAVGVYRRGTGVELLGEVDAGEYSGQTRFLDANEVSQEALLKRTRFTLCDDFTAFLLMTDGVSDPKFETEARLAKVEAWDALWEELETGAGVSLKDEHPDQRLLNWLDFWSQGNHDDRTIAIIY